MGKEQLYLQLDQRFAVGQAMQVVHEAQGELGGQIVEAVDPVISRQDVLLTLQGADAVTKVEGIFRGDQLIRPNIVAKKRRGEIFPEVPGHIPVRVNGEIVLVPEAAPGDEYCGSGGYTVKQKELIVQHDARRREEREMVEAVEEFLTTTRRNKDGEERMQIARELLEEEKQQFST